MRIHHLDLVPLDGAAGVAMSMLRPGTDPARVRVDVAVIDAGSRLPRHPAGRDQAFYVVAGTGQVAADDEVRTDVGPGDLVTWEAGEQHTTWATTRLTAVIVQETRP
ncbi:cupin domain-containing protein [Isoptericola sediminis]|uniref:Cupin domain-containing protein n=1 Tax=Isoptericola sediminis TaxID=2733572 RepID=A0A849K2W9_9MICO|nr:cupin domain-containing protein [Isoptericola sediminis]NNU27121.1 cupin domain-containing protein [Isoptericola sediminis]